MTPTSLLILGTCALPTGRTSEATATRRIVYVSRLEQAHIRRAWDLAENGAELAMSSADPVRSLHKPRSYSAALRRLIAERCSHPAVRRLVASVNRQTILIHGSSDLSACRRQVRSSRLCRLLKNAGLPPLRRIRFALRLAEALDSLDSTSSAELAWVTKFSCSRAFRRALKASRLTLTAIRRLVSDPDVLARGLPFGTRLKDPFHCGPQESRIRPV